MLGEPLHFLGLYSEPPSSPLLQNLLPLSTLRAVQSRGEVSMGFERSFLKKVADISHPALRPLRWLPLVSRTAEWGQRGTFQQNTIQ